MFIFSTIGCVVFTQDGGITTARQMEVSLIFGNAITILVFIFAGVSGANINPAVSLACALAKKISWARFACYVVAQCLGATTGAGFVRIMTPALFDAVSGALQLQTNKDPAARMLSYAEPRRALHPSSPDPAPNPANSTSPTYSTSPTPRLTAARTRSARTPTREKPLASSSAAPSCSC